MSAVAVGKDAPSPAELFRAALVALAASIDPRVVTKERDEPVKLVAEART